MSIQMRVTNCQDGNLYCIPLSSSQKSNIDIKTIRDFDFGYALQSYFPLLEAVFQYLNYNDLKSCMLVNEEWKNLADKVLEKRSFASWATFILPRKMLCLSKKFNYGNVSKCMIFYDYHLIKSKRLVCLHNRRERMTFRNYISKNIVPEYIDYSLISCPSVTPICYSELKDQRITSRAVFQSCFLPVIPNVKISMFHCGDHVSAETNKRLSMFIKDDEVVRCLLLFNTSSCSIHVKNLLNCILKGEKPENLAFGGGIIRGLKTFYGSNTKLIHTARDYLCITFQTKKNHANVEFNAASIVIPGEETSDQELEEYLEKLKSKCINRENAIAFRICCTAKVFKEIETLLFNKKFPKVPILGFDADGELGWTSRDIHNEGKIKNVNEKSKKKKLKRSLPKALHKWSSVFIILTWGKVINNGEF